MGILLGVSVMGITQCQGIFQCQGITQCMGILLGVSRFRVSALNRVCVCVSVRSISYWLEDCPTCDWTEGLKGGEFSLTHKHKCGGEFSLTHTHTHSNQEVSSHSLTH